MVWQRPGLIGNPGWVRSSVWIWLFHRSTAPRHGPADRAATDFFNTIGGLPTFPNPVSNG